MSHICSALRDKVDGRKVDRLSARSLAKLPNGAHLFGPLEIDRPAPLARDEQEA